MTNCAKGIRVSFQDVDGDAWVFGVTGSSLKEVENLVDVAAIDGRIINSHVEKFKQSFKADRIVSLKGLEMFIGGSNLDELEGKAV